MNRISLVKNSNNFNFLNFNTAMNNLNIAKRKYDDEYDDFDDDSYRKKRKKNYDDYSYEEELDFDDFDFDREPNPEELDDLDKYFDEDE